MFGYDPQRPLELAEASTHERDGARVHDVSYQGLDDRVTAHLVVPSTARTPASAGLVFHHWGLGNRDSFLAEAVVLARAGAVSLLVDGAGYRGRKGDKPPAKDPAKVKGYLEQSVIDLRRGIDLLCSRADVDPRRIGFVGHSVGAVIGGALVGVEPRVRAAVLMGGFGEPSRYWAIRPTPEFVQAVRPYDGVTLVGRAAGPVFFQFATRDEYIVKRAAEVFAAAAGERATALWYDADHAFCPQATLERARFLRDHLGLGALDEPALSKVRLPDADLRKQLLFRPLAFSMWMMGWLHYRAEAQRAKAAAR